MLKILAPIYCRYCAYGYECPTNGRAIRKTIARRNDFLTAMPFSRLVVYICPSGSVGIEVIIFNTFINKVGHN